MRIIGIEAANDMRIKILEVYGDPTLVIHQVNGDWETRHLNLFPYRELFVELMTHFDDTTFHHVPREDNYLADALAILASMFKVTWANEEPAIRIRRLVNMYSIYQ